MRTGYHDIPEELRNLPNWIVWRLEKRAGKAGALRETKVPYNVKTGKHAKSNGPTTWASFTEALEALKSGYDGIGFCLSRPYVGVDLDGCRQKDGSIEPWAQQILDELASYSELSPSGSGIHVIVRGELPDGLRQKDFKDRDHHGVGLYDAARGRYLTMTGVGLNGSTIAERTTELRQIHARLFSSKPKAKEAGATLGDDDLIVRAQRANDGGKFTRLWNGQWEGEYASQSEADLALCMKLAFWTNCDASRIDALFRRSGLMRDKWNREDYRTSTIRNACEMTTEVWTPSREVPPDRTEPDLAAGEPATEFPLPDGFTLENIGLCRSIPDGSGGYKSLFLCGRIEVVCRTRDSFGEDWGKLLRFKDPDGRQHEWIMPDAMLASERGEWRSHLMRLGLKISPAKDVTAHLRNYLFSAESSSRATKVDQIGWHGDVFVTPAWTVPDNTPERIILDDGGSARYRYAESGSFPAWRDSVASLCVGNSLLIFSISAALAPILLPLRPGLGGGFHFASNSTTGKTTNLITGGSVWGGGSKDGFVESWNSTSAGIEGLARSHNHSLLCLDEIKGIPPDKLAEIAYTLADGRGKARANRDATSKNRSRWELIYLSTGELGYMTHILTAERRGYAGQEVRNCEIRADRGRFGSFDDLHGFSEPARFAEALVDAALRNYGTAAPEFIRRFLAAGRDEVRHRLDGLMQSFTGSCRRPGMAPEVGRILNRFAFVAAAGELASEWGITGWAAGEAHRGVAIAFENCLEQRGTVGSSDLKRALEHVRCVLSAHANARLQRHREGTPIHPERPVINQLGYCQVSATGDDEEFQFRDFPPELRGPYDCDLIVAALNSVGALKKDADGKNKPKRKLPGSARRERVWVILPRAIFGGVESDHDDEKGET